MSQTEAWWFLNHHLGADDAQVQLYHMMYESWMAKQSVHEWEVSPAEENHWVKEVPAPLPDGEQ